MEIKSIGMDSEKFSDIISYLERCEMLEFFM